ncbi:NADP-dependent oxidoreductase [Subsaximicrobium wynnwilliamsii]|uniref:NADP-dependent oxidoreductase n=1 Tax=Subsaximicrobium wynnwilliamsii TaxID=291179 RepID=A0A5C6ZP36_9FLAO|nr:NADP-dependent oxidoreductase [Subsaximicrobium wynnwilliamsii]TXD85253.1 NADP-dependent oxidoreductase [Subsaximicrobium wynnwilliamsii]TXD91295.1 NADP-dependent oxidoreductase [Subsaximicrobium wynnwilliamsii]TXE04689.1 NADP-dependent oxidoreductase [Subsaximicrobium wynnwilliamsii]
MNKQQIFKKRPVGAANASTWSLETNPIPELEEGQVLIKNHYISLDPAMRGWMNEGKSYIAPVEIGAVMRAGSVGEVIKVKNHPTFKEGDFISGHGGVQQYVATDGKGYYKVDPKLAPLPTYIGTLGMPGMTAYFGILEVGKIKEGDIVVVSGAAGAVGSIVGQIAKIKGCKVIGIAGGADKCKYVVDELGFDACIDYKNEDVKQRLKQECPKGLDVYFDNVGGEILDAALGRLRMHARVVICGAISQYNNKENMRGPSNYLSLLVNRATMQGMVVFDWADRYGEAGQQMGKWMAEEKLKTREDVYEGIENFPETYNRLFSGEKLGKLVLKVVED